MRGLINKGEMFQFARWLNLLIGLYNISMYVAGGGYHLLGIGAINVGVWVFSRYKECPE